MATLRRISDLQLASIGTTKLISVSTAETYYQISSGNRAFEITNLSANAFYYGQSDLSTNSGGIITSGGSKFWDSVSDNFNFYLRTDSSTATVQAIIQEYAGN